MSGGSSPIRVLTVDDHPVVREGIAGLIGVQADMTLVGEAANGRDAIQQFRTHRPDVTLMDLQMPEMNGLDALIAIRTEFPEARIIMLTTYEGDVHILRAVKAGAQGYLLKNTLHSELLRTIRAVHAGKKSLSPEVSFQVAEHVSDETLTPAEVVVLRLIAAGNANKEIADQLGVTEDTVKGRVKSILSKRGGALMGGRLAVGAKSALAGGGAASSCGRGRMRPGGPRGCHGFSHPGRRHDQETRHEPGACCPHRLHDTSEIVLVVTKACERAEVVRTCSEFRVVHPPRTTAGEQAHREQSSSCRSKPAGATRKGGPPDPRSESVRRRF